jgi:hypothetical protein
MQLSKEEAMHIFAPLPEALKRIDKIAGDIVYFDLLSAQAYKTAKQNNLFHSLLQCFWLSGCSSFGDYDALRLYYKRVAGLVKRRDGVIVECSWADASKEQAKTAIDMCKRDMDAAGVIGSTQANKYEAILKGIKQWYEMEYNNGIN